MGRKRNAGDEWLPAKVYRGKSAFEYRPIKGVCIRLCPINEEPRVLFQHYEHAVTEYSIQAGSFADLIRQFFASDAFSDLAERTQRDYKRYAVTVSKVFGKMKAKVIRPEHIREYLDIRGKQTKVQANREHSFMSKVFSWAYERGKVSINPCLKVRKFTEKSRDRYITDEEYQAVLAEAPALLVAAMEISYCCAARQGDVINLERGQLLKEGLFIEQGKTNKRQIKRWSPRLRRAVNILLNQPVPHSRWLFVSNHGKQISENTLRHWYRKAKDQAAITHPELSFDFTFHDIKAAAISNYEGDKQKFSGHKTASQVAVYDRKTPIVDTH